MILRLFLFALLTLGSGLLTQCTGYQLGGSKPSQLNHVKSLYVPTYQNETITPRAQVYMTNATVDQLTTDGTYRIASAKQADATLRCVVSEIDYNPLRLSREDALRPQELSVIATVSYQVIDNNTQEVLLEGTVTNRTNIFVEENLQLARTSALPDLARGIAINLVSRITHGL